jgi:hypothetical protein
MIFSSLLSIVFPRLATFAHLRQQGVVILTKFDNFDVWHKILEGQ